MKKIYKNYELIKAIVKGEIKAGAEFLTGNKQKYILMDILRDIKKNIVILMLIQK